MAHSRAVQRHLEVQRLRVRAARRLRSHHRAAVRGMAVLDAAALLSGGLQPAAARDHGAQTHRARDQAHGLSAPRRHGAVLPLFFAPQRLHDDLRGGSGGTRPACSGAGGAERAVRIVPLLRVAHRRQSARHRRVQQQVRRARCAVLLGPAKIKSRGPLSVPGARLDSVARLGPRRQERRVQRPVGFRVLRPLSPLAWGSGRFVERGASRAADIGSL